MARSSPEPAPFTVEHFRRWALTLELDSGDQFATESFQEKFLADVFAGLPVCWLIVPEGNTKTTTSAALALYVCEFGRNQPKVLVAAASRDQAGILYEQAEGFVLRSPDLYEPVHSEMQARKGRLKVMVPRFHPLPGYRRVEHFAGGRIQVFAADERTGDGVMFTLAILDELHRHRDLALLRTWEGKRLKRGGQIIVISTAGEPGSEFELLREHIRQTVPVVEKGETFTHCRNEAIAFHEYAVPETWMPRPEEEGGPTDEDFELVARANPFSLITAAVVREKFEGASMTIPHFLRFTCNRATRGDYAAISETEWAAAYVATEIPAGVDVWVGVDPSYKWDTTAIVALWVRDPDFHQLGLTRVVVPPRDGNSLDPDKVDEAVMELHARNPIRKLVCDTNRVGEQLIRHLATMLGLEDADVIDRQQTPPHQAMDYERFMEGLREGTLHHSGDADLTRHALNAIAHQLPDGRAKFERPSQSRRSMLLQDRRVIDALTAAAMVHCQALAEVPEQEPCIAWV